MTPQDKIAEARKVLIGLLEAEKIGDDLLVLETIEVEALSFALRVLKRCDILFLEKAITIAQAEIISKHSCPATNNDLAQAILTALTEEAL